MVLAPPLTDKAAALTHIITAPVFPDIPSLSEKYFSF
jgi:hypothetical protein